MKEWNFREAIRRLYEYKDKKVIVDEVYAEFDEFIKREKDLLKKGWMSEEEIDKIAGPKLVEAKHDS